MTRIVALLGICLMLAACADEPKPVSLPPLSQSELASASATPSSPSPSVVSSADEEKAVRKMYLGVVDAFFVAQDLPVYRQRAYLEKWEVDPLLSEDLTALKNTRKGNYKIVGRPVVDIRDVTVHGKTAVVEDCIDHSDEYAKDTRTGRAIAGSRQAAGIWAFTTLVRTSDGWRASKATAKKKRCKTD